MPAKRQILERLKRDGLLELVDLFGIEPPDRRARDGLVDALASARTVTLRDTLESLRRDVLKDLCHELSLGTDV